jgi:xanthine dehydrogenase small subunit
LLASSNRLQALIDEGFLPKYFAEVPQRIDQLQASLGSGPSASDRGQTRVGGGTDLFVQRPTEMRESSMQLLQANKGKQQIHVEGKTVRVPAYMSIQDFCEHPLLTPHLPCLAKLKKLFASTQIRQQGTLAGNLVNASPIGDMANFLLALDTTLVLRSKDALRQIKQRDFYQGYKKLDLLADEVVHEIHFEMPNAGTQVNFEKVSRRTHLDIASVTSTLVLAVESSTITHAAISAGGVGPTPLRLSQLELWLQGRTPNAKTAREAAKRASEEITPISDVRGSAEYKKLLLSQIILAHFLACCPQTLTEENLLI